MGIYPEIHNELRALIAQLELQTAGCSFNSIARTMANCINSQLDYMQKQMRFDPGMDTSQDQQNYLQL